MCHPSKNLFFVPFVTSWFKLCNSNSLNQPSITPICPPMGIGAGRWICVIG
jgi:hypothetical protein